MPTERVRSLMAAAVVGLNEGGAEGNSRKPEKKRIKKAKLNIKTTVKVLMDFNGMVGRKWQLGLSLSLFSFLSLSTLEREKTERKRSMDLMHGNSEQKFWA